MPASNDDYRFLQRAMEIADSCRDVVFYGVGCLIVSADGVELATGYTGEVKEERNGTLSWHHAEEVAINKALAAKLSLKDATLYSTLEPCSERKSSSRPCCLLIKESGIRRVVYGAKEPFDPRLQIICKGDLFLQEAGVEVCHFVELADTCLESALKHRAKI